MTSLVKAISACLVFSLGVFSAPSSAEEPVLAASIGGQAISLPPIEGYIEASRISAPLVEVMKGFVPSSNRLLAAYLTEADAGLLRNGEEPGMAQYVMLQTVRTVETVEMTRDFFSEVKDVLKSNLSFDEGLSEQMNEVLEKEQQATVERNEFIKSFDSSTPTLLAMGDETEDSFAFTLMLDVAIDTDYGLEKYKMVYETVALNAAGKIVYIYVYDVLDKGDEIANVQSLGQSIKKAIFAAN